MSVHTIDDVIKELTQIIDTAKNTSSRLGYFPALYRKVTIEVKKGIEAGAFEDGPRMEKLDVIFAKRYLDALTQAKAGQDPTESWQIAFKATKSKKPLVLQHVLLGINTHINLDLGIAAAETMQGQDIQLLKNDFDKINEILTSLIDGVTKELEEISPMLKRFGLLSGKVDDYLARFGIEIAREYAWSVALKFAESARSEWPSRISEQDAEVYSFAKKIRRPGRSLRFALFLVRMTERRSIKRIIEILE